MQVYTDKAISTPLKVYTSQCVHKRVMSCNALHKVLGLAE